MMCCRCGPTDNVIWVNRKGQTHKQARCKPCAYARMARWRENNPTPTSPVFDLWRDNGAEYRFLREQGLTPREIGEKHDVRWVSFQRTLYRRIGRKDLW